MPLLEPFTYAFMQRALAEGVVIGVVCGLLGVLVVVRGLTFTGESISHTLVPGAAIAVAAGLAATAGALVSGVLAALAIALLLRRPDVGEETAVSVVFTGAFAVGVALLSTRGSPQELDSLLFGSILGASRGDVAAGIVAAVIVAAVVLAFARRFVLVAFDRSFATATGLRTSLLDAVLLMLLAAAMTVALRGVGTLLVLGLLVGPAAAARLLTARIWTMLALAPALAIGATLVGLELSYYAGVAAGPAICLTAIGTFVVVAALAAARDAARRTRVAA